MPKILDRLVKQLRDKGFNKSSSYAIATSQLQKSGNLIKVLLMLLLLANYKNLAI